VNYLDAAIGFSVVMAVFSGAVTVFVEALWRLIRIRKGNMIEIMKQLDAELASESIASFDATQRWELIRSVLNNPLRPDGKHLKAQLPPTSTISSTRKLPVRLVSTLTKGRQVDSADDESSGDEVAQAAMAKLNRKHALPGMFEKVTSEHVARKYANVFMQAGGQSNDLRILLKQVITKFERIYSCMSVEFKRRSQLIAMSVGIVAALMFNINGLRVLDSFIADPELSKAFVTELDQYEAEIIGQIEAAQAQLANAQDARDAGDQEATEGFEEAVNELKASVTSLSDKGVPIGHHYPPHCNLFGAATCDPGSMVNPRNLFVEWLLLVFTGALMGLGAPFWFDVAKRLSAVRSMLGGKPSATEAKSGRDANGSEETRRVIVDSIVADAGDKKKMNVFQTYFSVPNGSTVRLRVVDNSGKVACRASLDDASETVARWQNNDIKDGIEHALDSVKQFYALTLDMTYGEETTAMVETEVTDNQGQVHGEPWRFSLKGQKNKTQSAITTILMA
jgi:hypothetical protein